MFNQKTTQLRASFKILCLLATIGFFVSPSASADPPYLGATDSVFLDPTGCNATSFVQIPGSTDLFIGRQLLTADGQMAGISGPNDCSGGNPDNMKNGKVFNRWGLTLAQLDWNKHKFNLIKALLDTSIDPQTKVSRAVITGGPMRGAIIRSAYDADAVAYHGHIFVVYECTLENGINYGVNGTSACISVYDPSKQMLDSNRTQVIISGIQTTKTRFYAAAVPELLVFGDRLFLYWSSLAIENGKFSSIAVRGAELETDGQSMAVKGSQGHVIHSNDEPMTTEVWAPNPKDPTANTMVDVRALWVSGRNIIAMSSQGGGHCTSPSDTSKGCFRLAIVKADQPLGKDIFNRSEKVSEEELPSNPQEYTHPIRDPHGNVWFVGHYIKPPLNEMSETRPAPGGAYWQNTKAGSVVLMFPVTDRSLWPTE